MISSQVPFDIKPHHFLREHSTTLHKIIQFDQQSMQLEQDHHVLLAGPRWSGGLMEGFYCGALKIRALKQNDSSGSVNNLSKAARLFQVWRPVRT